MWVFLGKLLHIWLFLLCISVKGLNAPALNNIIGQPVFYLFCFLPDIVILFIILFSATCILSLRDMLEEGSLYIYPNCIPCFFVGFFSFEDKGGCKGLNAIAQNTEYKPILTPPRADYIYQKKSRQGQNIGRRK
jgi:hypothetical protein